MAEVAGGGRWTVPRDPSRPIGRLGFVWFVLLVASMVAGILIFAVLFALVAGIGGLQVAKAWRRRGAGAVMPVAGIAAAALPLAASTGPRLLGLAVLGATALSLVAAALLPGRRVLTTDAGVTVRSWLFVGMAAASAVLVYHHDLGAAIALVILMSAYDAGDYLVGAGARSSIEGPLAGVLAVGVLTFSLYVINPPPFEGVGVVLYGAVLAVLAPLGQLGASLVLPEGKALASGLRRVDSILLAGPVWVVLLAEGVGQ